MDDIHESAHASLRTLTPLRRLLAYAARYRRSFVVGLTALVCTQAVALAAPLVLREAIDDLTIGATRTKFLGYGGLLLVIGVVSGLFRYVARRLLLGAPRHVEYDIRNDLFARLVRLPATALQTHRTGDLLSRATNDLNAVRIMLGFALVFFANTAVVFVTAVAAMAAIDARLTLLALAPLPVVTVIVKLAEAGMHTRSVRIQAQLAEVSAVAQEAFAGIRVLRAYGQEAAVIERFRRANEALVDRNRALIVLQAVFFPSLSFCFGLAALVVVWAGSRAVIDGRITIGELVAFNAYLTLLGWPMMAFGWATNLLQRGLASWQRILELFDAEPDRAETQGRPSPSPLQIAGAIELRGLTFRYTSDDSGPPILDHVSLRIDAGQTAAIVGPTGSGKSTLIALLTRLREPPRGTIYVDGADVRDLPLDVLRGVIGVVPQEPFLFSGSIADNIAFGLDARRTPVDCRRARIGRAGAIARLDTDRDDFPNGLDTYVGERGQTLSGGQRQRTALARAIALDPRILVLDDALASVDAATEAAILARLRAVMRQRTSIIVSHRIAAVRTADIIFVLDDGQVVERGTDAELLSQRGLYHDLSRRQQLEEELAAS